MQLNNYLPMIPLAIAIALNVVLIIAILILIKKQVYQKKHLTQSNKVADRESLTELSGYVDMSIVQTGCNIIEHSSDSFSDESSLSRLLDFINTSLIRLTDADGGAILLVDDFEDLVSVKAFSGEFPPPYKLPIDLPHKLVRVESYFRNAHFNFTDNIFGKIVKSGDAELIINPSTDKRIHQNDTDFLLGGSYIFVPMKLKDTVIGLLALARKKNSPEFTIDNLETIKTVSNFASIAVKNIYSFNEITEYRDLTREARIATNLQSALYLKKIPVIPHLSIGNFFNTAEGVCGDYLDIIPSRKDRISFLIADVAGKGLTSLTIMSMLRAIMRVIVNTTQTAGTILNWANRGIAPEKAVDHYASTALLNYDPTTKTIQFATAGTTPILHYMAKQNTWQKISFESEPIGVEKNTDYSDHSLELKTDDIIVLYTDGLIESLNARGNQYSSTRLKNVIMKYAALNGNEIAERVKHDLKQFTEAITQHDDQTLLVLKVQ